MKITIYGSGFVGLITGACMAQAGNDILIVDTDEKKTDTIQNGEINFYEPNLKQFIQDNLATGRLQFTTSTKQGVEHGVYQFIAVGALIDDNGVTDTSNIITTAKSIAEHLTHYRIIVSKSTAPVGIADKISETIKAELINQHKVAEFDVVSNPEFLKEGAAIDDFMKPDRIIIGADNPRTAELMRELYAPFNRSRDRIVDMSIRSAELTKFAANALLATKISFMNELSNMAEILGADIEEVRLGIGSDPRIGYHFIYPGCGYGGSYFPKDVQALERIAIDIGYNAELLSAVESINERQKDILFEKLIRYYGESLKDKTIALWGLSFKPNTDDMHHASSRVLMEALWKIGANVQAYDPISAKECHRIYGDRDDLTLCISADDALVNADALVIATEWQEFRSPDFDKLKEELADPVIIDGRNLYNPAFLKELGFKYFAIGRGENPTKYQNNTSQ
ncbi:MAG: UDP-glucose/GDP-mannose dehydrogenase family protein [Cocleimonas sp.]